MKDAASDISQLEASVLPDLASLLVEYDLHDQFNIWLAHRHFQLTNENDRIVELRNQSLSVSSVFSDGEPDMSLLHRYNLVIPTDPAIVPDTFLSHDGQLLPIEFLCVERNEAQSHVFTTANVTGSFLEAWNQILSDHGVMDRFGLVLRTSEDTTTVQEPKLQLCDSSLKLDITLDSEASLNSVLNFPEDREIISSACGSGVPAVWEVIQVGTGLSHSIIRERRCWDMWTCENCGHSNGSDVGVCGNCGGRR